MLPALILAVALSAPSHGATVAPTVASATVTHGSHVRHELHLRHLHAEHLRHLAELESRRVLIDLDSPGVVTSHGIPSGDYLNCRGLMDLWVAAGGSTWAAFTAAEIAMAESGGYQYATGAAGERGFWQINPVNGSLSTYDKLGNAHAAIVISDDGRDWSAWTTYTHGLYVGRCLPDLVVAWRFVNACRLTWPGAVNWPDRLHDSPCDAPSVPLRL